MRLLKTIIIASLMFIAFNVCVRDASALVIIDYIAGPGKANGKWFEVKGPNEINFEFPFNTVDFWVEVKDPQGGKVNFNLNNGSVIKLNHHGTYRITVFSTRGLGLFYAGYRTIGKGLEYGENRISMCNTPPHNIRTNNGVAYGYLAKPGNYCKWIIVDNTGQVNIFFGWPKNSPVSDAEFHVKIEYEGEYDTGSMPNSRPGHTNIKTLGDWKLGGEIPSMIKGGGVFYITVYSVRGRGDWYCMFSPAGKKPYTEKPGISKPETKKPNSVDDYHHGGNQNIVGTWEITGLSGTGMESITLTFKSDGTWIHMTDTAADKPFYFRGTYETIGNTIKMKTLYSRSEGERWNSLKSFNLTSEANIDGNKLTYSEFRSFTYTKK